MSKGLPTLEDLRKTVPSGGLLNPGLRKGVGGLDLTKIRKQTLGKKKK